MADIVADVVRLDVEADPAGLVNLVQNPSGALGGYGWISDYPGTVLRGAVNVFTDNQQGLHYITAQAAENRFYSESMPVTPGQWIAARWHVNYIPFNAYRVFISWDDSSGVWTGVNTAAVNFTTGNADHYLPAVQVPAGAAYARVLFEVGKAGGTYPLTAGGYNFSIRDVIAATGATSAAVSFANLAGAQPVQYADVLGDVNDVVIVREELNLGTITATVVNPALDPATADTLRPGRRYRLTALNPATNAWEPLIQGTIRNAKVDYYPLNTNGRTARIALTGIDNTGPLANSKRPQAVANVDELPYVVEGCGVPWNINGSGQQVASATVVVTNDNASALDQIALTRDTELAHAWVDRHGTLQVWSRPPDPAVELLAYGGFESTTDAAKYVKGIGTTFATGVVPTLAGPTPKAGRLTQSGNQPILTISHGLVTTDYPLVIPGASYEITWSEYAATVARKSAVQVTWLDAGGNILTYSGARFASDFTPTTLAWADKSMRVTAPPNAVRAQVDYRVAHTTYDPQVQTAQTQIPSGEVHWVDRLSMRAVPVSPVVLDETVYNPNIVVDYDTDRCINSVSVLRQWTHVTEGPQGTLYGPYTDDASIRQWGRHHVEVNVAGIDPAAIPAYAASILAANAQPQVRAQQVQIPITDADSRAYAFLDLYDPVRVVNVDTGVDALMRITGITHSLRADDEGGKWLMTLDFASEGGVATPTRQPPLAGSGDTGDHYFLGRVAQGTYGAGVIWWVPEESSGLTPHVVSSPAVDYLTVTRAGLYRVHSLVRWTSTSTQTPLYLVRNGSIVYTTGDEAARAYGQAELDVVFRFAVNDQIKIHIQNGITTHNESALNSQLYVEWLRA